MRELAQALKIDWLKIILLLGAMLVSYGRITQKIEDLAQQVQRIEQRLDHIQHSP